MSPQLKAMRASLRPLDTYGGVVDVKLPDDTYDSSDSMPTCSNMIWKAYKTNLK